MKTIRMIEYTDRLGARFTCEIRIDWDKLGSLVSRARRSKHKISRAVDGGISARVIAK